MVNKRNATSEHVRTVLFVDGQLDDLPDEPLWQKIQPYVFLLSRTELSARDIEIQAKWTGFAQRQSGEVEVLRLGADGSLPKDAERKLLWAIRPLMKEATP